MKTSNAVQTVIRFLEGSEASLHEIATAINMDPRLCSNLLGAMMRVGTISRAGNMRSYVYSMAESFIPPEEVYLARLQRVHAALEVQDRLTLKEIRELLNETDWTTRIFLNEAIQKDDLHKQGKHGFFLSFGDYELYIEKSLEASKAKRRATGAAYRKARKGLKPQPRTVETNIVCEECRQNWQGYQVHKIFGSGARA